MYLGILKFKVFRKKNTESLRFRKVLKAKLPVLMTFPTKIISEVKYPIWFALNKKYVVFTLKLLFLLKKLVILGYKSENWIKEYKAAVKTKDLFKNNEVFDLTQPASWLLTKGLLEPAWLRQRQVPITCSVRDQRSLVLVLCVSYQKVLLLTTVSALVVNWIGCSAGLL